MSYLLIAGSRDFDDAETFEKVVREHVTKETVIVEGAAKGADMMAREYARVNGLRFVEFKPDWRKYGRAAGPKRNDEMTEYISDRNGAALYFWDGQSKGTKQCIESAKKRGIPVTIWNTKTDAYM